MQIELALNSLSGQ